MEGIDMIRTEEVFGNFCCVGLSIILLKFARSVFVTINNFNAVC